MLRPTHRGMGICRWSCMISTVVHQSKWILRELTRCHRLRLPLPHWGSFCDLGTVLVFRIVEMIATCCLPMELTVLRWNLVQMICCGFSAHFGPVWTVSCCLTQASLTTLRRGLQPTWWRRLLSTLSNALWMKCRPHLCIACSITAVLRFSTRRCV